MDMMLALLAGELIEGPDIYCRAAAVDDAPTMMELFEDCCVLGHDDSP
jgi:hypothetical protein